MPCLCERDAYPRQFYAVSNHYVILCIQSEAIVAKSPLVFFFAFLTPSFHLVSIYKYYYFYERKKKMNTAAKALLESALRLVVM